jgi:hypothetical protein
MGTASLMELQGAGMLQQARFSRSTFSGPNARDSLAWHRSQKIRVPREKSAGSDDFLYDPISYRDKSDLRRACNSLEWKGFIVGRMRADSTRLHRMRLPLLAKEGSAIGPGLPSAPSRLRVPLFGPLNLACSRRCWYFGRPFRRSANRIQPPASRSPSPAQGSMT